jgi:1-deoxy-D-xylulose-5-phosphate reductoisomerase
MPNVALLGSTGSIGTSCLEVLEALGGRFTPTALVAGRSWERLAEQCGRWRPAQAVLADESVRGHIPAGAFPAETELLFGADNVVKVASDPRHEIVVSAIVGAAGLLGTWGAVAAGKRVCLANKETLVVAGSLVTDLARSTGAELLPVDSEHSAVFQALASGRRDEVRRIVLTASGGPFRGLSAEALRDVTPDRALKHPTWNMGPKITIDSATLMNKALEVIEARWLFDIEADRIDVVIHPQSIVHSFVEFVDGSVLAQLSPPDMKLPIQYALTYPERVSGNARRLDWGEAYTLELSPPDRVRFPALELGFEVARRGGTCGAVLNAANEVAVARFLKGELRFTDIARACRGVLEAHHYDPRPTLDDLLGLDRWAREESSRWIS